MHMRECKFQINRKITKNIPMFRSICNIIVLLSKIHKNIIVILKKYIFISLKQVEFE
jgi:hypothetical protein